MDAKAGGREGSGAMEDSSDSGPDSDDEPVDLTMGGELSSWHLCPGIFEMCADDSIFVSPLHSADPHELAIAKKEEGNVQYKVVSSPLLFHPFGVV